MSIPIGIDLGTTTSEIAVFRDGEPEFLRDVRQSRNGILPSVVAHGKHDELLVGMRASRSLEPIGEVKRHMGTDRTFELGDRDYRPEEISSLILRHLKENAERILSAEIDEAVITVPADFKDRERHATIRAGELAGLEVERIVNEPTAAALAYGLKQMDENKHIVVYDFGGGTFDVSVLEMFEGVFEVKASAGNTELGGKNFDERVARFIEDELERQCDLDLTDLDESVDHKLKEARRRVLRAAEQAKIDLSSQESAVIDFRPPYLAGREVDFHMVLSRREFETEVQDLVERTGERIERALDDAGLSRDEIDEILLVGGTTRIPSVRDFVSSFFGNRPLPERVPPDEAVALGASVQAALKAGEIDPETGMIVTDVTSHSLGVATMEYESGMMMKDRMSVHIPRQTTIPVEETERYATVSDGQEAVRVQIYQGESKEVQDNEFLDEFMLSEIPPAPAGEEAVDVSFRLDQNAVLHVTATVVSTGQSAGIRVKPSAARMTDDERRQAQEELENEWKRSQFFHRVEPILNKAQRKRAQVEGSEREQLDRIVSELKEALAEEDEESVDRLDRELTDLLFEME